jgi:D-inositol-3-phosphate glycosyltransferase
MGTVARVHARRFDWDWSARRLSALYADLLDGADGRP